ncbi:MAG TPA: SDR family oxidoreductase [Rhodanobacteraceae bacterium]|nr:SDR family oxidoreductase [Rhodanobacteraceae bacterium]
MFGASGATGRELVKRALDLGHSVNAFVRHPDRFDIRHANLSLMPGNVTQPASVERAVKGQDAVASALGSGNSLRSDPALIDGIQNIVQAMNDAGVRRLVYLSVLGVGGSARQLGVFDRYIVVPLLLRNVVADHAKKEALIKLGKLDWVIVRPPRLTNGPYTGKYRTGEDVRARGLSASIARADVADFMVKQLADDRYVHKTPAVF